MNPDHVTLETYQQYIVATAAQIAAMEGQIEKACQEASWSSPWSGYDPKGEPLNAIRAQFVSEYTQSQEEVLDSIREYVFDIGTSELPAIGIRICEMCVEQDLLKAIRGQFAVGE